MMAGQVIPQHLQYNNNDGDPNQPSSVYAALRRLAVTVMAASVVLLGAMPSRGILDP